VAAVSGDARRALDICRRATELAERDMEDSEGMVTMQHVDQALGEMIASTKVQAIRYMSVYGQLYPFPKTCCCTVMILLYCYNLEG